MIKEGSDNTIKEFINDTCIIDMYAPWCGPCKNIEKILEKIEKNIDFDIIKINVDDNPIITSKFNIRSVPTLLFMDNGEIQDIIVGTSSEEKILNTINEKLTG